MASIFFPKSLVTNVSKEWYIVDSLLIAHKKTIEALKHSLLYGYRIDLPKKQSKTFAFKNPSVSGYIYKPGDMLVCKSQRSGL